MKKLGIFALAALFVAMFTLPAAAVEHQFGGYWRTRFFTNQNFTGEDETEAQDISVSDSRTRLYYTAVLNDNLKLVNKFEMDTDWGDGGAEYGDIGADGIAIEVKNTYAEFKISNWLTRVGTQPLALARGFLFDDDGTGLLAIYLGDTFNVPLLWLKVVEGGMGYNANEQDIDAYVITPTFHLSETMKINPYVLYIYSEEAAAVGFDDLNWWSLGVDFDVTMEAWSLWLTAIMQTGDVDAGGTTMDFSGWLAAIGGSTTIGAAGVHGEFVYASGDDDLGDDDIENFTSTAGSSYYWAEIMGLGLFDDQASNNAPGDKVCGAQGIWWVNLGVDFKPADKVKLALDLYYASLVEEIADGIDEPLGTEIDARLTYELVEGLNLDLVGAYLFAGESTTMDSDDDANPYELGAQLSLSF